MFRWFMALLLILSAGAAGVILRNGLKRRERELADFLNGLKIVASEISCRNTPLADCFERAARTMTTAIKDVFLLTAAALKENKSGDEAVGGAVAAQRERLSLTDADLEVCAALGLRLGENDREHTLKHLDYMEASAEKCLGEAYENSAKWDRVFLGGGWLGGIALALFFL